MEVCAILGVAKHTGRTRSGAQYPLRKIGGAEVGSTAGVRGDFCAALAYTPGSATQWSGAKCRRRADAFGADARLCAEGGVGYAIGGCSQRPSRGIVVGRDVGSSARAADYLRDDREVRCALIYIADATYVRLRYRRD